MKEQYWLGLLEEAPVAVQTCLLYFQERYPGHWRAKILDVQAVFTYLQTRDFELRVATFGIPNRKDWYCEVFFQSDLLLHERNFSTYERAAEEAITTAFRRLEKLLVA